jgi:hypothetical protein
MSERFNMCEFCPEGHGTDFAWDGGFSLCGSDHRGEHSVSEH